MNAFGLIRHSARHEFMQNRVLRNEKWLRFRAIIEQ